MTIESQIQTYFNTHPESKRSDMQELHNLILELMPKCKLWFLDGKNSDEKVVSNPNIGYGLRTIQYAGGESKEYYQIGVSANTAGISIYILGINDKTYLTRTYGERLGKAKITGYCIKFKPLKDIHIEILK
ncbi:DUF1801 domain-containing protein [Chryseobacterium sp.]|uniref:DUF1801 domain-containing protein n=1 Tax=Chryseobacterium sp. TaxID=1871047 RepID=UPI0025C67407|nr:DUF1801 domain-containing protein [Chryseobacterium sp.]